MTQENPLETLAFMLVIQTLKTSKKCSSKTKHAFIHASLRLAQGT
jgi:hypothetical protein